MDSKAGPPPVKDRYWLAGGTKPIPTCIVAQSAFVSEHARLLDFSLFAMKAFVTKLEDVPEDDSSAALAGNDDILNELIVTRTVDNFLCFVTDLLALIYKAKPEMLRSSEQERVDFVLRYSTMDELRTAIAEKKVERLSFLGTV